MAITIIYVHIHQMDTFQLKDFDLSGLAAVHPHLKELRLWGAPGNLQNFSAVREFRELTHLSTFDLFGFGADDIPTPEQMPELRWFWMTSLPAVSYTHLDSEIETVARECIAAAVAYILEWFNIPIDTEEAIRERDW